MRLERPGISGLFSGLWKNGWNYETKKAEAGRNKGKVDHT